MALIATESFDNGSTSTNLILYRSASINSTGGVYDGGCGYIPNNASFGQNIIQRVLRPLSDPTVNTNINFSFWIKVQNNPTSQGSYAYKVINVRSLKDNFSIGFGIGLTTSGRWYLTGSGGQNNLDGFFTSAIYASMSYPVTDNKWHFIEVNSTFQSSNRYTFLYQDGQLIITWPGIGTPQYSYQRPDAIFFENFVGTNYWIDDLTVWDQLGSNFVGYPKGPIRIQTLRPDIDVSSINVTSTGATNYEVLDEENGANTLDYITLSNTSNILLGVTDVLSNTTNVYGFITYGYVNSGQGGVSNIKLGHKIDSTFSYTGAQTIYTQTYSTFHLVTDNNFAGGTLSVQNVNNLIVSVDRTP